MKPVLIFVEEMYNASAIWSDQPLVVDKHSRNPGDLLYFGQVIVSFFEAQITPPIRLECIIA